MVIKIDPDTVLIRSGLIELFRKRFASSGNGICGTYRISATGAARKFRHHAIMVMLDMSPVGLQKSAPFRWRPVGHFKYIVKAMMKGYRLGENVQGGLYAIDGSTLHKLASSGFLDAMAHGQRGMVWPEDVLLPLGVKAVGGTISQLHESLDDAPIHIQASSPLQITQERLHSPFLLAVHPVKRHDAELRASLGQRRDMAG
jgi:hypothetical protein